MKVLAGGKGRVRLGKGGREREFFKDDVSQGAHYGNGSRISRIWKFA